MSRNLELARTLPAAEAPARNSEIRVRTGAPVSNDIKRLVDDIDVFAIDIAFCGERELSREVIGARVALFAERLRRLCGATQAVEKLAADLSADAREASR